MIVKEGFDGMSMQKLARAAGVSPATLYIYYANREDMLRKLYEHVEATFAFEALKQFKPGLSLEEGLWLQWRNRMRFVLKHPDYFYFFEQFRNSPFINRCGESMTDFRENMKQFVKNAVKNGELRKMEPEIFWSLAYGPFYYMLKFHLQKKSMMNSDFKLDQTKLKLALKQVVNALKPS